MTGPGHDDGDGTSLAWRLGYHAATLAAVAIGVPALAVAGLVRPAWRRGLSERLGRLPRTGDRPAWFHAASVGEVRAFEPLARRLRAEHPDIPFVLSVTTRSGRQVAATLAPPLTTGAFHLPLDAEPFVRRGLRRLRPRAFVTMETEIWPNLIHACARRGVGLAMVNGRISPKSFRRYRGIRPLLRGALGQLGVVAMSTDADAARVVELGAPPERVTVTGNLKFDAAATAAEGAPEVPWAERAGLRQGRWVVFASTAEGEEETVLEALSAAAITAPGVRAVLAPRHPERWDRVAELARRRGPLVRRSQLDGPTVPPVLGGGGVLLLDTLGELARLYRHAELVFVGGSLVRRGGHNLIEPAAAGCPVLFGCHVENQRDAEAVLLRAGGGLRVTAATLSGEIVGLLGDEERRRRMGAAARSAVLANAGAAALTVRLLEPMLRGRAGRS